MKIAICDDQKKDRDCLIEALHRLEQEKNIEFSILEYSNPEGLYVDCQARDELEVIFLDVYMDDVLGTDAAKKMRELGYKGSIIFCTTSEDHALDGFRVRADGYLIKPFAYEEFSESLVRLMDLFDAEQKKVSFSSERIEYEIPVSEIILIETSNKGCIVHTKREDYFTWKKLKDFIAEINSESFYQVGRFYLVNMNEIKFAKDDMLDLSNGVSIMLPKREAIKIRQDINDYIWKKLRK